MITPLLNLGFSNSKTINNEITAGLVAWYKLNGNATDSSGNGNNGSLINSPGYTTGENGASNGAISLNGINQNVNIPTSATLDCSGTNQFTLSAWVYAITPPNGVGIIANAYSGNFPDTNVQYEIGFGMDEGFLSTSYLKIGIYVSNFSWYLALDNSSSFPLNVWAFITGTYDGNTLSIYKNGILINSNTINITLPAVSDAIYLGRRHDDPFEGNGQPGFFNGYIDDARIYNRALSPTEISALYSNGAK